MDRIDSNKDLSPEDYAPELETMLYAKHAEIKDFKDLEAQRGTPIPALFSQFYKYIQNPSSVSVETFKRMIDTDDTVGSGVDFLITCLMARMGRYQHKSQEITEWMNLRLSEIYSSVWAGFSCSEKVWANKDVGFVIDRIAPLPPSTILFETDREGRLTPDGILQYQRNYNPLVLSQGIGFFGGVVGSGFSFASTNGRPDPFAKWGDLPFPMRTANTFSYLSIRIPKQKIIHYPFNAQGQFGNPYGRSLLRRAYKWHVLKDTITTMLAVALDRKGTPLTIAFVDPNTTVIDPSKAPRGAQLGGNPNIGMRLDEAVNRAFKNVHNDSFITLPGKKDEMVGLEFMPQTSNAADFIASIDLCNKSILRALLVPSLIFGNGDGTGSFALGQEHAKTFDKILDSINSGYEQVILQQMIKEMLAYNFPESAWKKDGLGSFAKRDLSQDERDKEMELYEKGIDKGIIDQNDLKDLNKMRDTIGFEPRDKPVPRETFGGFDVEDDGGSDQGNSESGNKPKGEDSGGNESKSSGHPGPRQGGNKKG